MSEIKRNKEKHETIYIGSMELLQAMAKMNALNYLKAVKFSNGYPLFGFKGVPKVAKMVNEYADTHNGITDHTTDNEELWKEHSDFITTNKSDIKKIVTRNISIVKEIVMSGYAYRINRVFIDKGGKRVYRFYTCPEIEKIKEDGDKISHDRWEKKQNKTGSEENSVEEKPVNEAMKKLIDEAMTNA
jgi:hypothetical protein